MGSKQGDVGQTPQQAELLKIAQFQSNRFQQTELPAIKQFGQQITSAHAPGSFERTRSLAGVAGDTAAAFGQARQQANQVAASRGELGSGRNKLGLVDMGADQATTAGFGAVSANQGAEDRYASGLGRMASIGRGQQATAINSIQSQADISGRQAADAAQRSLQSSIGTAGLIGQGLGTAAGMWAGSSAPGVDSNTEDFRGTQLPYSLRGGR